jgi:hypothetical protein
MYYSLKKICAHCFLVIAFALGFNCIFAQTKSKEVNTQSQSWFSINSTTRLSNHWGFIADAHMRRNNFLADPSFYFLRGAVNYWITDNITLAAGYGKMWLAPTTVGWKNFAKEDRLYIQLQSISKIGKIGILQRLRNENRWQQKMLNDSFTGNYKITDRIRYLLSIMIPVFKNKKYPSLVVSDELAIQFGKEVVYNTFEQNRLFFGIRQNISKTLSYDLGYMQVMQQKSTGYQYDKNNTFRLFFYFMPDLRKRSVVPVVVPKPNIGGK